MKLAPVNVRPRLTCGRGTRKLLFAGLNFEGFEINCLELSTDTVFYDLEENEGR